jgi:predicted phosphodiesterase
MDYKKLIEDSGYTVDTIGRYRLAALIGSSEKKARNILKLLRDNHKIEKVTVVDDPDTKWTKEVTDRGISYTLPKTRIHTKEQLFEFFGINEEEWLLDRLICNKWEVGSKNANWELVVEPSYQVKAFLRPNESWNLASVKAEVSRVVEIAKSDIKSFNINKVVPFNDSGDMALEVSIADLHLGKLAYAPETGGASYDLKIAAKMGEEAFVDLISRRSRESIGKICIVIGNDLMNSDNMEGQTTKGTKVSGDSRWHKIYQTAFDLVSKQVRTALEVAPVDVIAVQGNHDTHSVYSLAHSIDCLFSGNKHVTVNNSPNLRKYWSHGNTMIMFTHGDKEKQVDLPILMATESPELFGLSEFREVHLGHLHQVSLFEKFGVRVRRLPSLTPPDAWHSANGYTGMIRAAQSFTWTKFDGLYCMDEYSVKRFDE